MGQYTIWSMGHISQLERASSVQVSVQVTVSRERHLAELCVWYPPSSMNHTLLLQGQCSVAAILPTICISPWSWGPELGEPMLQAAGVTTPR